MTFSLVARCRETGMFGVAVTSSSPAVAARCAYARAGVGAVASQNVTDPSLGTLALELMQGAMSAEAAIAEIKRRSRFIDYRQLLAVDQRGQTAIHSGRNCLGIWAEARAVDVASGGNLLANDRVPQAVVEAFSRAPAMQARLGDRASRDSDQRSKDEGVSRVGRSEQLDMRVHLACRRGGFPRQADRQRCLSA